jgi:hypothetical protein
MGHRSSKPDIPEITVQSSMLSSTLPKKNPTAQGSGLPNDSASAAATTLLACNTSTLTGRTQKARPSM